MKEQLISFNTAKLAKEKGFEVKCKYHHYSVAISKAQKLGFPFKEQDLLEAYMGLGKTNSELTNKRYAAPTQSLLQKWLREAHGIHIEIKSPDMPKQLWYGHLRRVSKFGNIHDLDEYNTYEEALEVGLQEALKLI